jgi:hypothetical protein
MAFTSKVNRLEYISRMCFDNTQDEKKELMNFFSKLERREISCAATITVQAERIARLEAALQRIEIKAAQGSMAYTLAEIAAAVLAEVTK